MHISINIDIGYSRMCIKVIRRHSTSSPGSLEGGRRYPHAAPQVNLRIRICTAHRAVIICFKYIIISACHAA